MGASYLSYGDADIRIEADMLRMLCATIVKEFDRLPSEARERTILQRLRDDIVNGEFYGYTVVLDLRRLYPNRTELRPLIGFLEQIRANVTSFGKVLPKTVIEQLPGHAGEERAEWSTEEITTVLARLTTILEAAECSSSPK